MSYTFCPVRRPRGYAFSPELHRLLSRLVPECDLVHVHGIYQFHTVSACHLARKHGKPHVLQIHGALNPFHRRQKVLKKRTYELLVERRNIAGANAIVYTSQAEQQSVEGAFRTRAGFVVPCPVDVGRYSGSREADGRELVTFLGRLTEKKRPELALRAFAEAARTREDAQLVIAGPDDEGIGDRLRAEARALGIAERVSLVGIVTGEAKAELLRESRAFVLPSRDESFGVAVAEALAAGTPVVITPDVAIHGEVTQAGAGAVVPGEVGHLAREIGRLLDDPETARRIGENGRRLAADSFAPERVAGRLEDAYRRLLESVTRPVSARGQGPLGRPGPPLLRRRRGSSR
jgi:glycosyltransferase involved in cell wall biosynthesis